MYDRIAMKARIPTMREYESHCDMAHAEFY